MNAKAIIPALINVIGTPLKLFLTGVNSSFSLMFDIRMMAIVNPSPAAAPATNYSNRLYPESILMMAIPRTAQLVVIRGR